MGRASDIAARLACRAEDVCRAYLPDGRRSGAYWIVGDATGAKGQSCYVRLRGGRDRIGKWCDQNPANGDHFGDLLDLIRINRGFATLAEAMAEAEAFLGLPRDELRLVFDSERKVEDADKRRNAERLWARSRPIAGTKAKAYLRARGLDPSRLAALRYHPDAYYFDDDAELMGGRAQDRDGVKRYSTEICLENYSGEIVLLDGAPKTGDAGANAA
jgi:hypothetical protein